jgi:hypothetical protein
MDCERDAACVEKQAALGAERRQQRWLFFWLTAFAWATTLLTWPLFKLFGSRVGEFLDLSWIHITTGGALISYILLTWTISILVAGLLGRRRMQEERTI